MMDSSRYFSSRSGKATLSKTLKAENSAPFWNSVPKRRVASAACLDAAGTERIHAEQAHLSLGRRIQPYDHAQQRGLAAAGAAYHADDFAAC